MPNVIALVDDLMTASRLESAAAAAGATITFPQDAESLRQTLLSSAGASAVLLVGLATTTQPWPERVRSSIKTADGAGLNLRVIGFGPHMDLALRQKALDAGVQEVWANSRLMSDLPGLLKE